MKFYIAMMYLFAIIMAIYSSEVAAIIGIPVLLKSFLSVCLLVISGVVIYCAESVSEVRTEMDKEAASEIKRRIG